ncbi:hypothetical protein E2C01_100940 [Portunus trituberculatus]|uniref:Uncharacterized protein n=1 Tax=Portunus trituberculatus TaxID=210409 RepID=A0A5B7KJ74_PORTR|nr:hypothetical protein [Portunus trituberculatus]
MTPFKEATRTRRFTSHHRSARALLKASRTPEFWRLLLLFAPPRENHSSPCINNKPLNNSYFSVTTRLILTFDVGESPKEELITSSLAQRGRWNEPGEVREREVQVTGYR